MKVSIAWLKSLVETPLDAPAIANALTMAGLEVEEVQPVAPPFSGVRVAEVLSIAPHPDAQKLKVCSVRVDDGDPLQIVCGAANVAAGMRVPCAVVGARLPGLEIKAAKLRGVESRGMLCSARELGLSDDHEGLLVLPPDAPVGADLREWQGLDDTILTLKVTPNRGDCLSMIGVARDFAAVTNSRLILPSIDAVVPTSANKREAGITAADACGRYCCRVIDGLNASAATPNWMRVRLERAGMRCVSALVDITNYVMLERGQPMHVFDDEKLRGRIGVRFARDGETLELLNEQTARLGPRHLLVTDGDRPVALGGVMGGHASMCSLHTTRVLFESAWFDPDAVRGRAAELGLASDAAYRFERGVDPAGCRDALELATRLALQICGTAETSVGPVESVEGDLPVPTGIVVRYERVNRIIGRTIPPATVDACLRAIGCSVEAAERQLLARPPSYRFDLRIEEDLVEEVARVEGYDKIGWQSPIASMTMLGIPASQRSLHDVRKMLCSMGYSETINYSFVDESWERDLCGNQTPIRVANPIASHLSVMRTSLIGGLLHSLRHNLNQGETRLKLFEIGRCFLDSVAEVEAQPIRVAALAYGSRFPEQWAEGGLKGALVDFFAVKGEVESLLARHSPAFVAAEHPALHPGRCARIMLGEKAIGWLGELHPRWLAKYELKSAAILFELDSQTILETRQRRFAPFPRTQTVRRDIALRVDERVSMAAIAKHVADMKRPQIVDFCPFDVFRGPGIPDGEKSVAFRVVMQDTDRTLTDIDVDRMIADIVKVLSEKTGATLR
jgi:phenylalanyl-tRNA synthetase beta chain